MTVLTFFLFFRGQLARLGDKGIPVYLIAHIKSTDGQGVPPTPFSEPKSDFRLQEPVTSSCNVASLTRRLWGLGLVDRMDKDKNILGDTGDLWTQRRSQITNEVLQWPKKNDRSI